MGPTLMTCKKQWLEGGIGPFPFIDQSVSLYFCPLERLVRLGIRAFKIYSLSAHAARSNFAYVEILALTVGEVVKHIPSLILPDRTHDIKHLSWDLDCPT